LSERTIGMGRHMTLFSRYTALRLTLNLREEILSEAMDESKRSSSERDAQQIPFLPELPGHSLLELDKNMHSQLLKLKRL